MQPGQCPAPLSADSEAPQYFSISAFRFQYFCVQNCSSWVLELWSLRIFDFLCRQTLTPRRALHVT